MPRETCYTCWRPSSGCLCPTAAPMETRTRIVLLMHPKEYRHQKCTTGRLTCLNLANSEIIPGIGFDDDPRFRALIDNPGNYPVLLYPGEDAIDIHRGGLPASALGQRRLVVFLVDATWHCARTIMRHTASLAHLPRLSITPGSPSRYVIKHQPAAWCLSTIEATHELLLALEAGGLDTYPDKSRLIDAFNAMQDYQLTQIASARKFPYHVVRGPRPAREAAVSG